MVEVILENLPAGVTDATIQAWYFEEGDAVMKGDEVAELTTDEGSLTVVAPASGILAEVYYDEGESVAQGEILCLIEDEEGPEEKAGKLEDKEEDEEDK